MTNCKGCGEELEKDTELNALSRYGHGRICSDCGTREALEGDFIQFGSEEVTDQDRAEIARLIEQGNTSGILDSEGYRISWDITINKFKN